MIQRTKTLHFLRSSGALQACLAVALAAGFGHARPAFAQAVSEAAAVGAGVSRAAAAATGSKPARHAAAKAAEPAASIPADAGPSCVGGLPQPVVVRIDAGKATLVNLPEPITRRTLGDPKIAEGRMVSPQVLYLVSGSIGTTNAILQGRSGQCVVLEIVVAIDTNAVQAKIHELLPAENGIRVTAAADSLVLSGSVSDAVAAEQAVSIANAYVRAAYQQGLGSGPGAAAGAGARTASQGVTAGGAPVLARVVNMLSVSSAQQVMLEVKVAEVSKTLLDKLGAGLTMSRTNGSWTYQLLTDFLLGGTNGGLLSATKSATKNLTLEAEKRDGLVRILAEPNVMAISGQEGSFLAGGKILIPVAQDTTTGSLRITLEEKEFGVGLKFTPTVLEGGRINLKVAPEVSELSREGVGISNTGVGVRSVFPLITTRRAATTVQLHDGQSFAIGGLIKSTSAANIDALPVLGELPVIGALFRSTDFQTEKTELVFIVTPRLVKPLPPNYSLPTDKVLEPTRQDLFLGGRLDGAPAASPGKGPQTPSTGGMELK